MMKHNITYDCQNNAMECIYYKDFTKSYPMHTHADHIMLGYVTDGEVCVICDGREALYHAGESFCIMPDVLHALEPVNGTAYSMVSICIPSDKAGDAFIPASNEQRQACIADKSCYSKRLKRIIQDAPEHTFSIEKMAQTIGVSPYHMIRQFKSVCGLTPHQFQIQCRVRKAQRLLEAGSSVTEAAYATGFCDQSHFDRCFRKIVRLTPSEYKQAVK